MPNTALKLSPAIKRAHLEYEQEAHVENLQGPHIIHPNKTVPNENFFGAF